MCAEPKMWEGAAQQVSVAQTPPETQPPRLDRHGGGGAGGYLNHPASSIFPCSVRPPSGPRHPPCSRRRRGRGQARPSAGGRQPTFGSAVWVLTAAVRHCRAPGLRLPSVGTSYHASRHAEGPIRCWSRKSQDAGELVCSRILPQRRHRGSGPRLQGSA